MLVTGSVRQLTDPLQSMRPCVSTTGLLGRASDWSETRAAAGLAVGKTRNSEEPGPTPGSKDTWNGPGSAVAPAVFSSVASSVASEEPSPMASTPD